MTIEKRMIELLNLYQSKAEYDKHPVTKCSQMIVEYGIRKKELELAKMLMEKDKRG